MRTIVLIFLSVLSAAHTCAQKPLVDTSVYGFKNFPSLGGYKLSNDGNFLAYFISNQPVGRATLVIKAVNSTWSKEIIVENAANGNFSTDSRFYVFNKCADSVCLLALSNGEEEYINSAKPCQLFGKWLVYWTSFPGNPLILRDLETGNEQRFEQVSIYKLNKNGSEILITRQSGDKQLTVELVHLDKRERGDTLFRWHGAAARDFTFSADGKKLAFWGKEHDSDPASIWCFQPGSDTAELIVSGLFMDFSKDIAVNDIASFNSTGDKLFFYVHKHLEKPALNPAMSSVDVYSYKNPKLQSEQLRDGPPNSDFMFVFNFADRRICRLGYENEHIAFATLDDRTPNDQQKYDHLLVEKDGLGDLRFEQYWNPEARISVYLVSTEDGSRKLLCYKKPVNIAYNYCLSPLGKYVIYYDPFKKDYFSYNISSGTTSNITKGGKIQWTSEEGSDYPDSAYSVWGNIAGWLKNDSAVIIKSRYDIFEADPEGKRPLVDLTNNYGSIHHIRFELALGPSWKIDSDINPDIPILLESFNSENRNIGFCKVQAGRASNPQLLCSLPNKIELQKAQDADQFVLWMENAETAPNLFITKDLKTFVPITDIHPEKKFNWIRSELITWKSQNGSNLLGVLYKPENFDPKKKYPVIFTYYERMSYDVLEFTIPDYSTGGGIDIPTYVSNGYLIFTPDIWFKVGYPGRSACNTIVSAAKYLSKFSWVDKEHFGLRGQSFGGFQTNYVITHSHLFACAVSTSGMSDLVSIYGSVLIFGGGWNRQAQCETGRERIGATLWQRPDLYLVNSPVLLANKITTPVLMMANIKDDDVPYEQGFEFFTALRRLGKKAWMLQYNNGSHLVHDKADQKDITIRTKQFFDHYLKETPPPKWMTEGIPATRKQIDNGYELDTSGKKP